MEDREPAEYERWQKLTMATRILSALAILLLTDCSSMRSAVLDGDTNTVEHQLASGQDPNGYLQDPWVCLTPPFIGCFLALGRGTSDTPLFLAVKRGRYEVARLLLEKGANPNLGNRVYPPLYFAAEQGNVSMIQLLGEYGADANSKAVYSHETPLHSAAREGHANAVRALLELGASPNEEDSDGKTPRQIAESQGHASLARLLKLAESGHVGSSRSVDDPKLPGTFNSKWVTPALADPEVIDPEAAMH